MKLHLAIWSFSSLIIGCLAFKMEDVEIMNGFVLNKTAILDPDMIQDSNLNVTKRITNGNLAKSEQFPYQVYLLIQFRTSESICGGSVSLESSKNS